MLNPIEVANNRQLLIDLSSKLGVDLGPDAQTAPEPALATALHNHLDGSTVIWYNGKPCPSHDGPLDQSDMLAVWTVQTFLPETQ